MQNDSFKKAVIDALEDMKVQNITVLDVKDRTQVTDWMIIASGTSSRHISAVADHVEQAAKAINARPYGSEGRAGSDWVLIDLGDIVVHIMTEAARAFYDLERLWGEPSANDCAE